MLRYLIGDCCNEAAFRNEPYCPVCASQLAEHKEELGRARAEEANYFCPENAQTRVSNANRTELCRRMELPSTLRRGAIARNPARLAVFKILGIYLPEEEAQAVLKEIHTYKWLVAEKVGKDIWQEHAPEDPFAAAAREWARRHLNDFLRWVRGHHLSQQYA
ncbi:MAG: hypothetical protein ACP5QZ_01965 [Candidatus Sumerlaeaceae bacterium]